MYPWINAFVHYFRVKTLLSTSIGKSVSRPHRPPFSLQITPNRKSANHMKLVDLYFDNFNSPTLPPVGYGPTPAYSGKIALLAGQVYSVEIDHRRVGGFFDSFEQGGLTGIQASWASLEASPNFVKYDAVIICAGISNEYEGEGEDRAFTLPEFQDELIKNLSQVNHRTIVEFFGGGNFDSHEWINQVSALIETFYPGQDGGQALAEILFGDVNPSGKLPVTFEKKDYGQPCVCHFSTRYQHPSGRDSV